ncbi:MAG: argininosuccinate lyase [Spirochaetes bacterium]|nr:argininosuccinate lyase [Spirochaetota bacterium]
MRPVAEKKKPWGGRFTDAASRAAERLSASIQYDSRLYRQDIRGSRAHARMLHRMGILDAGELEAIVDGLGTIEREIREGDFEFSPYLEDIHMNIESRLTEMIGDAGRKLHTARSRNDQIALDVRLYLLDESGVIRKGMTALVETITAAADRHIEVVMPGYTHLQIAQPVRFSHHLLAYAWMFLRDLTRLDAAADAARGLPLGCGALAGVNYENDREFLREELGFDRVIPNSMDAVADRDYILDFLYFAAVLGTHLSRMGEELVLWSSAEFGYLRLADAVTTGSSIMPQKRNPDIAELLRGKTGRLYGNMVSLMTVLKGLPMAYNRDLQEDKEPLFDSIDTVKDCLEALTEMIATMTVRDDRMRRSLYDNFSTATDLADYLVMKGIPFRSSHEIVGALVKHCEESGEDFFTLPVETLKRFSPAFGDDAAGVLRPDTSPERKLSSGSTSKGEVKKQIAAVRERLRSSGTGG